MSTVRAPRRRATDDPVVAKVLLTVACLAFLALFLVAPLVAVFQGAMAKGVPAYWAAVRNPEAMQAIKLTLTAALFAVPLNLVFGLASSWALTKFEFRGKSLIIALIELPIAISPVISGLILVLFFGARGVLGPWLEAHRLQIIFAVPGIVLATTFVTFPFIAREVMPTMQSQGTEEEQAALSLGATGWQVFWRVTLPNVRWAVIYGVILCNARAMGEFGAVSVVSAHIRGRTNTLPLYVELLYNDYDFVGAFAAASLLTFLAVVTLIAKSTVEWWTGATRRKTEPR
jgi:sulfate transport system permease protein